MKKPAIPPVPREFANDNVVRPVKNSEGGRSSAISNLQAATAAHAVSSHQDYVAWSAFAAPLKETLEIYKGDRGPSKLALLDPTNETVETVALKVNEIIALLQN